MPVKVELDGVDALVSRFKLLGAGYDDVLKKALADLAAEVVSRAAPNVPRRTGKLASTLRSSATKTTAVGRVGSAAVPYAAAVHWKYGPPFLTDAAAPLDATAAERQQALVDALIQSLMGG